MVIAVGLGGYAVTRQRAQVAAALVDLTPLALGGSLLAVIAGLAASMQVWRSLLAAAGSPLPLAVAARIFFVGQLGKYIPGSVWPIVAQMDLAGRYRVPRRRSATIAVLTMLISLGAALVIAVAAVPLFAGPTGRYRWLLLAAPAALAGVHPRVLNPVLDRLLRLARRPPLEGPLTGRAVLTALGWALLSWLLLGSHAWLLAAGSDAPSGRTFAVAVGGFALAWSAGFLAVFAPAGVGVRDVVLVATLGPVVGVARATAVAVVSRVVMTLGDLLVAAVAGTGLRRAPDQGQGGAGGADSRGTASGRCSTR